MILAGPPIRLVAHPFAPFTTQVINVFNHSLNLIDAGYPDTSRASPALEGVSIPEATAPHKGHHLAGSNKGCDPVGADQSGRELPGYSSAIQKII
jgi:hypothetical protein